MMTRHIPETLTRPSATLVHEARRLAKEYKVKKHYFTELAKVRLTGSRDFEFPFATIELLGSDELRAEWSEYVKDFSARRNALQAEQATQVMKDFQSATSYCFTVSPGLVGGVLVRCNKEGRDAELACKSIAASIESFASTFDDSYGLIKRILKLKVAPSTFEFIPHIK